MFVLKVLKTLQNLKNRSTSPRHSGACPMGNPIQISCLGSSKLRASTLGRTVALPSLKYPPLRQTGSRKGIDARRASISFNG